MAWAALRYAIGLHESANSSEWARLTNHHRHCLPPRPSQGQSRLRGKRSQGHDAALSSVVGPHDDNHILKSNREVQQPENRRNRAYDIVGRCGDAQKYGLNSVQWICPDVAENYSQSSHCKQHDIFISCVRRIRI